MRDFLIRWKEQFNLFFYLWECISLIIYIGFLGFMTLFPTMQTELATLQLQACKYLPNKADLVQLMNLGEAGTGATNGIHCIKWKPDKQTAPFPWALLSHAVCHPGLSVCCMVLWCYICAYRCYICDICDISPWLSPRNTGTVCWEPVKDLEVSVWGIGIPRTSCGRGLWLCGCPHPIGQRMMASPARPL